MAYLYDLTDTWNAAGTVFNAIKMNVTNTASAAGSKIVSLQVGATDRFTVDKDGNGYFSGTLQAVGSITAPNVYIGANSGTIGMQDNTASILAYNGTGSGGITNTLRFITGAAERVRIDGSGNVGIGTSSPGGKLAVASGSSAGTSISTWANYSVFGPNAGSSTGAAVGISYNTGSDVAEIAAIAPGVAWKPINILSDNFRVTTNNAERLRVDNAGNVGIGTSSPYSRFTIVPSSTPTTVAGANQITVGESTANSAYRLQIGYLNNGASGYNGSIQVYDNGNAQSLILNGAGGNVGIGTSSPLAKLNVEGGDVLLRGGKYVVGPTAGGNGAGAIRGSLNGVLGSLIFQTENASAALVDVMTLDGYGNLGLDATPSAWGTAYKPMQIAGQGVSVFGSTVSSVAGIGSNGYYDGTNWVRNNSDSAGQYQIAGNVHKWYNAAAGSSGTTISFTQAMTLDASGNLGIGTSSPNNKLDVNGSVNIGAALLTGTGVSTGDAQIELGGSRTGNGNSYIDWHATAGTDFEARIVRYGGTNGGMDIINTGTGGMVITNEGASPMVFKTNATERARIDGSGNLMVGTTSSYTASKSAFYETTASYWPIATRGNNRGIVVDVTDTSGVAMYFTTSSGANFAGQITISGTSTTYATSSDARLKHDIVDAPEASSLIDAIKVRSFKWNADNSEQRYGMVAQELLEVAPEAVSVPADEEAMMGVDYSKLVPMLIKEVQQLRARVAQLEGN